MQESTGRAREPDRATVAAAWLAGTAVFLGIGTFWGVTSVERDLTTRSRAALAEAGIDALIGVDPVQGGDTDLAEMNRRTAGRFCLWGGMNGFVTVEMGTPAQVAAAAKEAIELTAPGGGFVLSPVDNVVDTSPKTWENVDALIRAWRAHRAYRR